MASSSGKDQEDDHIQEPVHERGQRNPQASSAAAATSTDAPIAATSTDSPIAATSTDAPIAAAPGGGPDYSRRPPLPPGAPRRGGGRGADVPPLPPRAPRIERLNLGRPREPRGGGGCGTEGSSAAVVDRKGKKVVDNFSPTPPSAPRSPVFSDDDADDSIKEIEQLMTQRKPNVEEKVEEKPDSPKKKLRRSCILAFKNCIKKKLSDIKRKQLSWFNQNSIPPPHVDHKTIPIDLAMEHYIGDITVSVKQPIASLNLLSLEDHCSELRPVYRDGESFYRSFMFSYLEQVLDRKDTDEETRLLKVVAGLTTHPEGLHWASQFSQSRKRHRNIPVNSCLCTKCELIVMIAECNLLYCLFLQAFEKLIKEVIRWKSMQNNPGSDRFFICLVFCNSRISVSKDIPSYGLSIHFFSFSYDKGELLLEFFSSYATTDEIFVFLRVVTAIWACAHKARYQRLVAKLGYSGSLEDWCSTQVVPLRVPAGIVQVKALSPALGVAIRLYNIDRGGYDDIHRIVSNTPHLTMVCFGTHYDILYRLDESNPTPTWRATMRERHPPAAGAATSSRQAGQEQGGGSQPPAAAAAAAGTSSQPAARAESPKRLVARWFHYRKH
ncbi:hypothetical protein ABZP36_024288 [Zizania latifolia]